MKNKVPIIVGPTAVGKTALSILLAQKLNSEIISADSRQIFKYMDIGTAKVERDLQQKIPHHFIDILEPDAYYSAGMFAKAARLKIYELLQREILPIVVGGSGLYIRALTDGIFEVDAKDEVLRNNLLKRAEQEGLEALYKELQNVDPVYSAKLSTNDKRRILRALEVYLITGRSFSDWHNEKTEPALFETIFFGLNSDRPQLYNRINERVEQMLQQGLVDEVQKLQQMGYHRKLNALNTVGYKEVFSYLAGEITFSEMSDLIKRNSRRYAKRQLTWYNADQRIKWFNVKDKSSLVDILSKIITNF